MMGRSKKLADAMGLSLSRLNAKINGSGNADFTQSEVAFIRTRYKLSNKDVCDIFLHAVYLIQIQRNKEKEHINEKQKSGTGTKSGLLKECRANGGQCLQT